jgi:predicted membrane protein
VGGLVFLGLLLLSAFSLAAITPVSVSAGIGEKSENPVTVTELDPTYELGIGDLELDLGDLTLPAGTTSVDASVGIGKLVVTVPEDVAVEIDAHAGVGSIDLLGARDDGVDADRTLSLPGSTADAPVLDLEADIAIGDIEVRRG